MLHLARPLAKCSTQNSVLVPCIVNRGPIDWLKHSPTRAHAPCAIVGLVRTNTGRVCSVSSRGITKVFKGVHTLVIKIKNTPKTLISGQKSTLIFKKRWLFPLKKHPFFYQNTDIGWTGTRILTLDIIILCLFSGSRLGSSDINIDNNNIRCITY